MSEIAELIKAVARDNSFLASNWSTEKQSLSELFE